MPIFTSSKVGAFPAKMLTTLSLSEIADALVLKRPDHEALEPGWGGPVDGATSYLGVRDVAPPSSDPVVVPADGPFPERLHARYYFFKTSSTLREYYAHGTEQEQHVLDAIDVLISRVPGKESEYLCLFSSSNGAAVGSSPYRSLREQILGSHPQASFALSTSHLDFETPDVFLWMLTRTRSPQLDESTVLASVDAVAGQDESQRVTSLSNGVDFDRPAFLVAVAEVESLGPVRVMLRDSVEKSRVTLDLWRDGSFKLITSKTHYRQTADDEMRMLAVCDLAYVILPMIRDLYVADADWRTSGRENEIRAAATALIERYRLKYPGLTSA